MAHKASALKCCHRWLIEPVQPGRVRLKGVCKLCGEEGWSDALLPVDTHRYYPNTMSTNYQLDDYDPLTPATGGHYG